ncbi:MAG: YbaN family protein, partial [Acidimicrobiia bacterium]|nr:YbaN family protein [Acidimicrobiia bacterium]
MNSDDGGQVVAATTVDDQLRVSRSAAVRAVYVVLGFIFLGIGIAGFYLPVLPGTINLIVAAYFFSMSSERMFRWMMTNKAFGQQLQDYRAGLGIPRNVKVIATVSIVASVT